MSITDPARRIRITYRNHRGEVSDRTVLPYRLEFTATPHHPEPQWVMHAWCYERGAERSFAVRDIEKWEAVT